MEPDDHHHRSRSATQGGDFAESRPRSGFGLGIDGGLVLGVVLIGIALGALLLKGFKPTSLDDPLPFRPVSHYDPYFNGGYLPLNVNTASREELLMLPLIDETIADGIIARRPFGLTEELKEIAGISDLNLELFTMFLYGFDDAPEPRYYKPPGIPDA